MIEYIAEATTMLFAFVTMLFAFVGVIVYLSLAAYFICFHGARGYHKGKKHVLEEDAISE